MVFFRGSIITKVEYKHLQIEAALLQNIHVLPMVALQKHSNELFSQMENRDYSSFIVSQTSLSSIKFKSNILGCVIFEYKLMSQEKLTGFLNCLSKNSGMRYIRVQILNPSVYSKTQKLYNKYLVSLNLLG